jgi:dienelactone hydrolase
MFVAEAGQDRFAPGINDSIDRFVKEARARNVTLEFMIHPTGHHGFDTLDNDDRSKEIVRKTLDFLKTYLTNQS